MTFLKWFSIIWLILSASCTLYVQAGKKSKSGFIFTLLVYAPIIVYLFLS